MATSDPPQYDAVFSERTGALRRDYLCGLLEDESEYHRQIYIRCASYISSYRGQYVHHRRQVHFEDCFGSDWDALTVRQKAHILLEYPFLTAQGCAIAVVQILVTLSAVAVLLMETDVSLSPIVHKDYSTTFLLLEFFFTIYFTLETIVVVITHPNRTQLLRSFVFVMDMLAVLPLYATVFIASMWPDMEGKLDAIRMLRVLRLVRFVAALKPVRIMMATLKDCAGTLLAPALFLVFWVFLAGSAMYFNQRGWYENGGFKQHDCECESKPIHYAAKNPPACPPIDSVFGRGIPYSFWWAIATSATVGYGDVVPTCSWGRVIGAVTMIGSVMLVAMPVAVITNSFVNKLTKYVDDAAVRKAFDAKDANRIHQKALQLVLAHRLHELRHDQLVLLCHKYQLAVGTQAQMCIHLYDYFGEEPYQPRPPSTPMELPVTLSLAETLVDYLKRRTPHNIINIAHPNEDVLCVMDAYFERIFAWWAGHNDPAHPHFAHRLMVNHKPSLCPIIPLVAPTSYSIGIEVEGVPDPDFVLPIPEEYPEVALSPRMARVDVRREFGVTKYVLKPHGVFCPLVNGEFVPDWGVVLRDRDMINFGTEAQPITYIFALLDEFAAGDGRVGGINDDLAGRVWAASIQKNSTLRHLQTEQPQSIIPTVLMPLSEQDIQFLL